MKAAVLCASGLGDALLMMISACQLKKAGYEVTVYLFEPDLLRPLFPSHSFSSYPPLKEFEAKFSPFDLIILENDNSERAWRLFDLRDRGKMANLRTFFPTPCGAFRKGDILFNPHFAIATNIATATQHLLGSDKASRDNDLAIPPSKTYKKYPKRVVIHPTSKDPKRNWKREQFLAFAQKLKVEGYDPIFSVAPHEVKEWEFVNQKGFSLLQAASFMELAEQIYESGYLVGNDSGLGHLASNLGIPTLTIAGNRKRVKLWRPNWTIGEIITPKIPLPNWKGVGIRLRENYWQNFVTVGQVWKRFNHLVSHES